MPITLWRLALSFSLVAVGSSEAQRVGQGSTIRFGTVRNVQQVQLQSDAATGALVGGTACRERASEWGFGLTRPRREPELHGRFQIPR